MNEKAMAKMANGTAAQYADTLRHIHKMVLKSGAARGEFVIDFDDGTAEEGEFVPELVLRVKMVGPNE